MPKTVYHSSRITVYASRCSQVHAFLCSVTLPFSRRPFWPPCAYQFPYNRKYITYRNAARRPPVRAVCNMHKISEDWTLRSGDMLANKRADTQTCSSQYSAPLAGPSKWDHYLDLEHVRMPCSVLLGVEARMDQFDPGLLCI